MRQRIFNATLAAAYGLALWWTYTVIVGPNYSYEGFRQVDASPLHAAFATMLVLIVGAALPVSLRRPSYFAPWLLSLFVVIPVLVVSTVTQPPGGGSVLTAAMVVIGQLLLVGLTMLPRPRWSFTGLTWPAFHTALGILTGLLLAVVLADVGLNLRLVGLFDVYATRADYKAELVGSNPLTPYAVTWLAAAVAPAYIAIGLTRKPRWIVAIGVAIEVYVYGVTGFKSALFAIPFLVGLYVLSRLDVRRMIGARLFMVALSAVVVATVVDWWRGGVEVTALVVLRVALLPALLTSYYVDFFSTHDQLRLSRSILRGITPDGYGADAPSLIGFYYFGSARTNANANIWADGFAQFGLIGVLLMTVVVGGYLWLFDGVTAAKDVRLASLLIVMLVFSWTNGAALTALLNGGGLLVLVIAALLPRASSSLAPERGDASRAGVDSGTRRAPVVVR